MTLAESKLGENYFEWVSKLKESPQLGRVMLRALCSYQGLGGVVSEARLNEIPPSMDALVKKPAHTIYSDEGKAAGGTDKYPSPLLYLVAAAGFCFLSTLSIHASALKVKIDAVDLDVRGHLDLNGYYSTHKAPVGITRLDMHLKLKSPESKEIIEKLVKETEDHCPVYQTLTKPPTINMKLELNH